MIIQCEVHINDEKYTIPVTLEVTGIEQFHKFCQCVCGRTALMVTGVPPRGREAFISANPKALKKLDYIPRNTRQSERFGIPVLGNIVIVGPDVIDRIRQIIK